MCLSINRIDDRTHVPYFFSWGEGAGGAATSAKRISFGCTATKGFRSRKSHGGWAGVFGHSTAAWWHWGLPGESVGAQCGRGRRRGTTTTVRRRRIVAERHRWALWLCVDDDLATAPGCRRSEPRRWQRAKVCAHRLQWRSRGESLPGRVSPGRPSRGDGRYANDCGEVHQYAKRTSRTVQGSIWQLRTRLYR